MPMNSRRSWITAVSWLALCAVYVGVRVNLLEIPLDRDEGGFGILGKVVLDGGVPYIDAIEQKPPLVFFIMAVALAIVPPTAAGIHLFLHVYNLATLIAVYAVGRQLGGKSAGLWGALSFALLSALPQVQGFTASTELFLLLPLVLGLWFALRAGDGRRGYGDLFWSGLLGAAAFWTKQSIIPSVGFVFLIPSVRAFQGSPAGDRVRAVVRAGSVWLAGAATLSAAIVGYFFARGAIGEFWYWGFVHNLYYSRSLTDPTHLGSIGYSLLQVVSGAPLLIVPGIAWAIYELRDQGEKAYLYLGFLLFSLLAVLPGQAYPHYYAQIVPALALVAGYGFARLAARGRDLQRRTLSTAGLASVVVLSTLAANLGFFVSQSPEQFSREFFGRNPFPESREIAEYLRARTSPEDEIFIFGSEPQIPLMAQRDSASAFIFVYSMTDGKFPRHLEFQDRMVEELRSARPAYVLFANFPMSTLSTGDVELRIVRELDETLRRDYRLEEALAFDEESGVWQFVGATRGLRRIRWTDPWQILIFRRSV